MAKQNKTTKKISKIYNDNSVALSVVYDLVDIAGRILIGIILLNVSNGFVQVLGYVVLLSAAVFIIVSVIGSNVREENV